MTDIREASIAVDPDWVYVWKIRDLVRGSNVLVDLHAILNVVKEIKTGGSARVNVHD